MYLDERNEFADATALSTGGTGRQLVGDVIDTGVASGPNDISGSDLWLVIQVDTAFASAGAATVDFALVSDAQAAIATDGTATTHYSTGAQALASLTAGAQVACVKLPRGTYERYLGVIANVATAALTAGKVNAFLTSDVAKWTPYADAAN